MNPLAEIQNDISGLAALRDWLGDGAPVDQLVAHRRAEICGACPQNVQPGWWDRNLKLPVARTIRAELELKSGMRLFVPNEAKLGMCRNCGCCNLLAVHVPIAHLKAHTRKSVLESFPEECWKKKEILAS